MSYRKPLPRLLVASAPPATDLESLLSAARAIDDWEPVLRAARYHGVHFRLAFGIGALEGRLPLPGHVAEALAAWRRAAVVVDMMQVATLRDLRDRLRARGIPFIVLKGLGIAERVDAEPWHRARHDLDVLVRPEDLSAAGESIEAMGYADRRREAYARTHFHRPYASEKDPSAVPIELHWQVTPASSWVQFDVAGWWSRVRSLALRAGECDVPPLEDEIAYLGWQMFSKGFVRLGGVADFARLLERDDVRSAWAGAARAADAAGAGHFLRAGALLAARVFPSTPAPVAIADLRSASRRLLGAEATDPERWLARLEPPDWAEAHVAYWSLLPERRAGWTYLFRSAVRGRRDDAATSGVPLPPLTAARATWAVARAVVAAARVGSIAG